MFRTLLRRFTLTPMVLVLAALLAFTGTATAAKLLTGKDIKDSSLTGKDIKDRSLTTKDFAAGQLPKGAAGPAGSAGSAGAPGAPGAAGAPGPQGETGAKGSDANVVVRQTERSGIVTGAGVRSIRTLSVPAGSYMFNAHVTAKDASTPTELSCFLTYPNAATPTEANVIDQVDNWTAAKDAPTDEWVTFALIGADTLTSPQTVTLSCDGGNALMLTAMEGRIVATQVGLVITAP